MGAHLVPGALSDLSVKCTLSTRSSLLRPLRAEESALGQLNPPESQSWESGEPGFQSRPLPRRNPVPLSSPLSDPWMDRILALDFFFLTRFGQYRCEKGTTAVLTEKVTPLEIEVLEETVQTMDTS